MQVEEFEAALDEYGVELADWPAHLARQARALLEASSDARDILEAERSIASAFAEPIRAPAGLSGRILAQAFDSPPPVAHRAPPRLSWWQSLAARLTPIAGGAGLRYATVLAICFVGGLAVALVTAPGESVPAPYYVSGLYADLAW